jgi:hypothetical protein
LPLSFDGALRLLAGHSAAYHFFMAVMVGSIDLNTKNIFAPGCVIELKTPFTLAITDGSRDKVIVDDYAPDPFRRTASL